MGSYFRRAYYWYFVDRGDDMKVPENVECLRELKQYLFFYCGNDFRVLGNRDKAMIVCIVPPKAVQELAKDLPTKITVPFPVAIGVNSWVNRLVLKFKGFEAL